MKDTYPSEGLVEGHIPLGWGWLKAAQTLQMIGFSIILDDFGPKTTQKLQSVSFGTILNHFGPRRAGFQTRLSFQSGFLFAITIHSKRLSIRNGFGITPKGPMGPSPQGRRRRPWVPLGPFGSPWVPLGPFGSPWPPKSWGSPRVPGVPLGPRDRHLVEASKGRLER